MIRDWTNSVRDTVVFFTNHGLTRFRDDDDNLMGVVDGRGILAVDARAPAAVERAVACTAQGSRPSVRRPPAGSPVIAQPTVEVALVREDRDVTPPGDAGVVER
jgi:hypothetical protein